MAEKKAKAVIAKKERLRHKAERKEAGTKRGKRRNGGIRQRECQEKSFNPIYVYKAIGQRDLNCGRAFAGCGREG